ncbi:MAG: glycosyltransferase [Phycisphaeraceae bacterium]|nr:glycosyltransferase [Phycisphaeraceae bacterium]
MHIVHVIDALDPAHGGPSVVCTALAAAQAGLGHRLTIVSFDKPGAAERTGRMLAATPGIDGVDVRLLPRPRGFGAVLATPARRELRSLLASAQWTVLHGVWDPVLLAGANESRRAAVPYCVVPHGMLEPWCMSQKWLKKKASLLVATRRMLNSAAFLHALNPDEVRGMIPHRLSPPVHVIPNGVFLEEVDPLPPPGAFRSAHATVGDRPYILFLSRIHFRKGLDHLADAFAILAKHDPGVALVVAGPDDGERGPFESRIARHGLADRVLLTGPIYGRDKFAAFADAACFCLPSREEGFSMAILEALACRTPVVISDHCHFPEVAEAGAGEVVPLTAEALAAALARVLQSPERAEMGQAGRRLIEQRYTWRAIAEQSLGFYQSAAGTAAPASPRT